MSKLSNEGFLYENKTWSEITEIMLNNFDFNIIIQLIIIWTIFAWSIFIVELVLPQIKNQLLAQKERKEANKKKIMIKRIALQKEIDTEIEREMKEEERLRSEMDKPKII